MKAIILNASPRKNWNTAQLLKAAQQGAEEAGAAVCSASARTASAAGASGRTTSAPCWTASLPPTCC